MIWLCIIVGFLNILISYEICFEKCFLKLIGKVFLYDYFNVIKDIFWIKNGEKIEILNSEEKYLRVNGDNLLFIMMIFDVNG